MPYAVTQRALGAVEGFHNGTGLQTLAIAFADPSSVADGSQPLRFTTAMASTTTLLFEIADTSVVPNWFGVAVPPGLQSAADPILFFHPTPSQGGYVDSDYASKAGKWPSLFYYLSLLGLQVAAANRDRITVMPFMTQGAVGDAGILPAEWQEILTQVLGVAPRTLTVASFSSGITYSSAFRSKAQGLEGVLQEVWDFDGAFSEYSALSNELLSAPQHLVRYDQSTNLASYGFHVPPSRWSNFHPPPADGQTTHNLIPRNLFTHATLVSSLGVRAPAVSPVAVAAAASVAVALGATAYLYARGL